MSRSTCEQIEELQRQIEQKRARIPLGAQFAAEATRRMRDGGAR